MSEPYASDTGTGALGLFTDLYEFRMAQTCLAEGMTGPATFSLYVRPAPERPWFVAAGTQAAVELLDRFLYGDDELDYLRSQGLADDFLDWLGDLRLDADVWAVPDGTVVLGDEPLVEVTAPLPAAMLLETAIMNVVHFPTVIATKAARCRLAAGERALADFGLRRAHGLQAGLEAARAAYVGGVGATSNVEAGRRFGIPVVGTMAHSFIQAWGDETDAFRAFASHHPGNAILLVDTYDTIEGVRNAVVVGDELRDRGETLDGVRLDSGDLIHLAKEARKLLDDAGHTDARIFASGGVDEFRIRDLAAADAPIDAFGVGTSLTTSRDQPALDVVYKLVEYEGHARAKYSVGKELLPGAKQVFRDGSPASDVLGRRDEQLDGERLLVPIWQDGGPLIDHDLDAARERAARELASLPEEWRGPDPLSRPPTPRLSDALAELAERTRAEELGDSHSSSSSGSDPH